MINTFPGEIDELCNNEVKFVLFGIYLGVMLSIENDVCGVTLGRYQHRAS